MKQVTIENVKKRILELQKAGYQGLAISLNEERELDCLRQLVAVIEQLHAVVAENAALKSAFEKPQAYLSWHAIPPTWEDPLPCGEYLDVHDTAGHKNSDGTDCWPVFAKPEIETPATDAAIAALRAEVFDSAFDEEPFGTVRRSGNQVVIDVNGDPHIKDGMPVFARQSVQVKGGQS